MGEVIHGDYIRWANAETLHSVTNYHLHKALFSGYNDHNFFEIAHTVKRLNDMCGGVFKLYNFVDNHDVERIMSKLSSPKGFVPVHIMLYTLPGVPSLYYGSEFGIEGKKGHGGDVDAPLRPELDYDYWNNVKADNSYVKFITALANIRQQVKALSYGDYREQNLTTRQYTYSRSYEGVTAVVMVNNDDNACTMHGSAPDGTYKGALSGRTVNVCGGGFSVEIEGNSGEIWIPENVDSRAEVPEVTEEVKEKTIIEEVVETAKEQDIATTEVKEESVEKVYDLNKPYEEMSIEELQAAILAKMAKNGPVTEDMKRTVVVNTHQGSLINWVRSFN